MSAAAGAGPVGEAYAEAMERWAAAVEGIAGGDGFARASEQFMEAFVQQQALRAQSLERWSEAMEEIVGSEAFAAASGQLLALYAQQQQAVAAASRVTAETLRIPSSEDLAGVAQLVVNVERKVDEVADRVADMAERIAGIERAVTELASRPAAAEAPSAPAPTKAAATRPRRRTPTADS